MANDEFKVRLDRAKEEAGILVALLQAELDREADFPVVGLAGWEGARDDLKSALVNIYSSRNQSSQRRARRQVEDAIADLLGEEPR